MDDAHDTAPTPRRRRTAVSSRRQLLGAGALAGAAAATATAVRVAVPADASKDREILQFLLMVERAQAAFYGAAVDSGRLQGELARYAAVAGADERAHVARLEQLLGGAGPAAPPIRPGDAVPDPAAFTRAAVELEDTGIAAYVGQGGNVTPRLTGDLTRILGNEGRHVAWIRAIAGEDPAPRAQDLGRSAAQVQSTLRRLKLA